MFTPKEIRAFNFTRALQDAGARRLTGTFEAEILQEATQKAGRAWSPESGGFHVPFELLRRDLLAANTGAAIVGTEQPFALDVLRPYSATLRSGAQLMRFQGNATVPRVAAPSTAHWLDDESSDITESQATIGQIAMTPKNVATLTEVSEQMMRQTDIDRFLRRDMMRTLGTALDKATIAGSGSNGEPLGILNTTGVGAVTGASFDWVDATDMLLAVGEADVDENITWFGAPGVRRLLSRRERVSGGGRSIWDDREVAGFPAIASQIVPAGSLVLGAFGQVVIAIFADGIDIQTQHTNFARGLLSYRAWLSADIAVTEPAAFARATSIT
ncbi:MAG: phage major capsid protein [Pseudomonadota bacterium]